jgi:galactoside O-acetyltransferase
MYMSKAEMEKMHTCELYLPDDEDIAKEQMKCLEKLYDFNQTRPSELGKRQMMLKDMFAQIGDNCYIEPPLHANWGGKFVHFGKHVYANFNLTLVDDTYIYVGDNTMFGPNVTVATAGHPIQPELRAQGYQYNAPVFIGNNCWIGAGATILPGVRIGENTVVGAGSVVASDLPSGVVAAGNPCKVIREVGEQDRQYYFKDHRIDFFQYNHVSKNDK